MTQNKKRLLVLSAPIGSGHKKAAEALCQTFKDKFNGEAFHVDFYNYLSPAFGELSERSYYLMIKYIPIAYEIIYKNTDRPAKHLKQIGNLFNIRKYKKLIEEYKPDLIISTHFLPSAVVSWMHKRFPIVNGVVITDYTSHSMWAYPNNNKFFVAHDKMIKELENVGVEQNKICVSGIPVRSNFLKNFDKKELIKKLGLSTDKPIVMMMSGGNATCPFADLLESLSKIKKKMQLIVVTGHNKKMYKELKTQFKELDMNGKVLGFVENIEEYMAICSLLISKAGGLTVAESLAVGLPIMIINPTPGQEDGNTEFLVKTGAAIYLRDIKMADTTVDNLLGSRNKLKEMSDCAKKISSPNAAEEILDEMMKFI